MSSEQFKSFGRLLDAMQSGDISQLDLAKIANASETVRLLEIELRSRYSATITAGALSKGTGKFESHVHKATQEVLIDRGRGAYNTNNLIVYALMEARLESEEKFMTPQQIAFRIDRVIQTIISSKGTAENLLQPPYFIESKKKTGWRLAKREA